MTPTWPKTTQKQLWALLSALLRGERLSTIAALKYGCASCSQRINDLRRLGWPIEHESMPNDNGGYHFEYFISKQFMDEVRFSEWKHERELPRAWGKREAA